MSTYYYLICNDYQEKTNAASRVISGNVGHLIDSDHTLLPFIVKHHGHDVKITSEYDYELYDPDYEYKKWTKENMEELYEMGI